VDNKVIVAFRNLLKKLEFWKAGMASRKHVYRYFIWLTYEHTTDMLAC